MGASSPRLLFCTTGKCALSSCIFSERKCSDVKIYTKIFKFRQTLKLNFVRYTLYAPVGSALVIRRSNFDKALILNGILFTYLLVKRSNKAFKL